MASPAKPGPPSGYLEAIIHTPTAAKVSALGMGEWRKPIHGTAVLVAADGRTVLGHIRTLGILLPVKDRRYSLRIKGVTFKRIAPLLSLTRPIISDLAAYDTMQEARVAGTALVKGMIAMANSPSATASEGGV